jgi:hypothetical protein
MSRRTIRDFMSQAFFARDKASFAKVADEAEEELGEDDPKNHAEPDGDEGEGKEHHASNIHIHVEHGSKDERSKDAMDEARLKSCEDGIKSLDAKLTRILDALPEALKEHQFGKKNGDDDDKEETTDEGVGSKVTEEGASTPEAATMNDPPSAEAELMEADPVPEGERMRMGDAAYNARRAQGITRLVRDTVARAEILVPGIKVGTFDAVPDSKQLGGQLCALRRNALLKAAATDEGRAVIGNYAASLKTMSCDAVRYVFRDASDRMRAHNNARSVPSPMFGDQADQMRTFRQSNSKIVSDINKANREYWAKQGVGTA